MIKWSSTVRLDDYVTVKALRRQVALIDKTNGAAQKPRHRVNEELAETLAKEVAELSQTMRTFGMFSDSSNDLKKRVDLMRRVREDLGEVFLYTFRVANALDIDVTRSVHEKILKALKESEEPWMKNSKR
ncbi:hypothetical protein HY571_01145 [Candidatus Micrarchaeota archaeon]|nr:hypothetical protein [Candidatus Micrarchaeota archaeon]